MFSNKLIFNSKTVPFSKKTCEFENNKFDIIKYDKPNILPSQYNEVGFLRSMIMDSKNHKIISVSPHKSVTLDYYEKFGEQYVYEEFIDGVMINIFKYNGEWEISTRSIIGGNKKLLTNKSNKTFKEMFLDACSYLNIDLKYLPDEYCYTTVLQHPKNRIVKPIIEPNLCMVEVHKIVYNDERTLKEIKVLNINGSQKEELELREKIYDMGFSIPKVFNFENYDEAVKCFGSLTTNYEHVGIIIKDFNKGLRTKIRNPTYEEIKLLRGNHSKKQFLYYVLRHSNKVKTYLKTYPEDKNDFTLYRQQLHHYTNILYKNYVDCFILKQNHVNKYPFEYKINMTKLHSFYLNSLLHDKKSITRKMVIDFVNKLHPKQLMFLINYKYRNYVQDQIKVEKQ